MGKAQSLPFYPLNYPKNVKIATLVLAMDVIVQSEAVMAGYKI
jgi:hypothetical protein